jgi:hypothetical protein
MTTKVVYYSLARQALKEALLLAGVSAGDSVVVPALICKDVLLPIESLGASVSFYEVDKFLQPIGLTNIDRAKAIIAVNYFGFAQDLTPFVELGRRLNAVIIEDNAHGFLSSDRTGQLLGTRTEVGITSIRKTLRIPNGASLSINNESFQTRAPLQLEPSNDRLGIRFLTTHFASSVQRTTKLPLLRLLQMVTRLLRRLATGSTLPIYNHERELASVASTPPSQYSLKVIERIAEHREIARRRKLYNKIEKIVGSTDVEPVFNQLPDHCTPYGFPFYASPVVAKQFSKSCRKFGVEVIHWPDLPDQVSGSAPDFYKNLWLVNFL